MADNSAKAVNMARNLAIAHLIVGFLLFCFGIGDRVTEFSWTGEIYFGIWIGAWMLITGVLGIPGTRKEKTRSCRVFAGVFMACSTTSTVLGGIIITSYGIAIGTHRYTYNRRKYDQISEWGIAVLAIILILGIVEFTIGIWAAICVRVMNPCGNNTSAQQGQVVYTANGAFVLTPGSDGAPVAIPIQGSSGMFATQPVSTGAQGNQLQMVMVPVTVAGICSPQQVQAVPAEAATTGYQPLQVDLPPPYEEQPYMTNV